jgi:hypothetical protein
MNWANISEEELKKLVKQPHLDFCMYSLYNENCPACIARYQLRRRRLKRNKILRGAKQTCAKDIKK